MRNFTILKRFNINVHPPNAPSIKETDFFADMSGAIRAIELAYQNHWQNLWLETDSILV
ncbi:hypothetical protein A2U01_0036049, partial [Trifolium medium]|nr:hypothetical protein [Trifolium medium]